MKNKFKNNQELAINTLRVLSATAINKANSGHTGICLGAAAIIYELFVNHLNISPINYKHFNRDRFVLSAGHGAPLLYSAMLLCGYSNISIDDLKNLRQIYGRTSGHPEPTLLDNIDVATGPLGQGIAMAVGLAISEKKYSQLTNGLVDHYTYCLFGDGCLQEGVAYEALTLAAHYKLNKLIMFYDSNNIQLDGPVNTSTSFKTKNFFKSIGWNYILVTDGNNPKKIAKAIKTAKKYINNKPTLIECKTHIGFASDLQDSNKIHGVALNNDQLIKLRHKLNYDYADFVIPNQLNDIKQYVLSRTEKSITCTNKLLLNIEKSNPNFYKKIIKILQDNCYSFQPSEWLKTNKIDKNNSTRNICNIILQDIIKQNKDSIIVSSADLTNSTKVVYNDKSIITSKNFESNNLPLGVREFAMACINNGIVSHKFMKAIGSTFLCFSDYCKPATRIAAISNIPSIFIYSHDSITVGEDGPTHQPIEQLWMLRSIPNHYVFRPCNYEDMLVAFDFALKSKKSPCSIITSRNPFNLRSVDYKLAQKGAYIIFRNNDKNHNFTIYATGSEVDLAIEIAKKIEYSVRVVAINSFELLYDQDQKYIDTIFDNKPKISIEFGSTIGWYKYVDLPIGIDSFGLSGKSDDVIRALQMTTNNIITKINNWYNLKNKSKR